jgi:hypothetical protein
MPIDFPNSPAVNDTFTVGDRTWKWTGVAWESILTTAVGPAGATGPSGVIAINAPITNGGTSTSASLGLNYSTLQYGRNLIINGAFEINQRNYVSAANLASGAYGFDRWKSTFTNTTLTFTSAPQGQLVTINSGGSIEQVIERANVPAGTYTLSWSGTATGRVYNTGATPPAYAASPITVTLDGLQNVEVEFTASGGTRTLGFVQLEVGSVATPFKRNAPSVQGELAACQRYYYRQTHGVADLVYGVVAANNTTSGAVYVHFPVTMRVVPTALEQTGTAANYAVRFGVTTTACSAVPAIGGSITQYVGHATFTVASGITAGQAGRAVSNAVNAFLGWTAEL